MHVQRKIHKSIYFENNLSYNGATILVQVTSGKYIGKGIEKEEEQ